MVNVTNVISIFNEGVFDATVQNYNLGDLQFKTYFPSLYTAELTFKTITAVAGAKIAADVVAFGARAPRKGDYLPSTILGDIPKINIDKTQDEQKINTFRQLLNAAERSRNPQAAASVVKWMYDPATKALDGVNARIEYLAKQAVSTGKYILTPANNTGGIVTKVPIDFQIPSGNKTSLSGTAQWIAANAATSDPIKDIKAIQTTARGKGLKLNYITMDNDTFNGMTASVALQKNVIGYVGTALNLQAQPNLATVNNYLSVAALPTIRLWDSYVGIESKDGTQQTVTGWDAGAVVFSLSPTFGDVQWTDTADSQLGDSDVSVKSFNDFTMVKTYAEQNPPALVTLGIAYATPVLNNANQTFILKTA